MRRLATGCFGFALLILAGCAMGGNPASHTKKLSAADPAPIEKKKKASPSKTHSKKKKSLRTPLFDFKKLPTIVNSKDQTVMVLIDPIEGAASGGVSNRLARASAFYIDQKEITVRQYRKLNPEYDETRYTGAACPDCPVMGVNWKEARGYCLKAGKRLPTEREWETAAGGKTDRDWPWGNKMQSNRANISGDRDGFSGPAPVGSFPHGASQYGVLDMSGNVWEWVNTPYKKGGATRVSPEETVLRIVKGGGWTSPESISKTAFRNVVDPELANPTFGFRCAKSLGG